MNETTRNHITLFLILLFILHAPLPVNCQCKKKPVIFNFGDSNSDTGSYAYGLGLMFGPPNGRIFAGKLYGRLTDGRLVIDFLCENLKTSFLTPFLEPLAPDFRNGANFAVASSTALPKHCPFGYLDLQILQFLRLKTRSLELISEGWTSFVDEEGFQNALYTFDIGQIDIAGAFDAGLSYEMVIQTIPLYLKHMESSLRIIYQHGGKNFWIHSTSPLGSLPQRLATSNQSDFDEHGCLKSLNIGAAKVFNQKLSDLCKDLRSQMKDATIVYTDLYVRKYELIANYKQYGFENPLMACCGHGGPPYNFNATVVCGQTSNECSERSKYISWDGVHYTEAANAIVASKILSTDYSSPKLKFNYFCQN